MNKLSIACLIGLATATFSTLPAEAAKMASHSKYCESFAMDPMCMSPKMLKMRMAMMKMTKQKVMENRSKYCRENAAYGDPMCTKKMMNSTMGF